MLTTVSPIEVVTFAEIMLYAVVASGSKCPTNSCSDVKTLFIQGTMELVYRDGNVKKKDFAAENNCTPMTISNAPSNR